MAPDSLLRVLFIFGCSVRILSATSDNDPLEYMSKEGRKALKEEARDMFYHAYNAYMDNAYPADELMPLSCKGRYRGSEPNRGDIDSTLGNFSLTLVDTLDTLVVLGDLEEFENAVKLVARDVNFDTDVIVSLFETNIRMLGGLLSGHILAEYLQQRADIMPWYRGELLDLAKDLGYRFLPAFNTSTGIPYGRINLKHGMKGVPIEVSRETCTACAGSLILEMAALSRLTGESIFEEKAQKAMDVLWRMRHRGTDLMGSVLNVNSGDWVRRDSGVGAGIDSYYEYCLKAYILLGDEKYLGRFNKHYQAIMKYVSQGPMLLDVQMHRPNTNSKNFMDALLAFWPGLQVLKGDIKPAVETHEMLYQVMQRHNFIPEAFTTDFQVHWGHHPLRPEFLESTYFLYRATGDHYYLGVGHKVLKSLQTYARVPCGYAAVSDVRTNKHDDNMDSFVLSETFKYLFLLFAEPGDLVLDLDEFIFTTEGHLLPLTLASIRTNISSDFERDVIHVDEFDRTCPNSLHLFPASVRQPLRNMVEDVCPRRSIKRRLSASQFQTNNLEHLKILSDMGITTLTLADGRVQLLHTFSNAKTPQDSEEGLLFMQEMVELSRLQSQQTETKPQAVTFVKPKSFPPEQVTLLAGPAHFGPELQSFNEVIGNVVFAHPLTACSDLLNTDAVIGKIAIMDRGDCMFIEKARRIQKAGAIAGIVLDNVAGSNAATSTMFAMSGDKDDITIPIVFLFSAQAAVLIKAINDENGELSVTIGNYISKDEVQLKAPTDLSMFEQLKGSFKYSFLTWKMILQTSTSSGSYMDVVVHDTEHEHESTIEYNHLRAEIIKDPLEGEIRITATSNNVPLYLTKKSKKIPAGGIEMQWHQLKQVFVNQIYAGSEQKTGFHIRAFMLKSYYNWILKERSVHSKRLLNERPLKQAVFWFLTELGHVAPDPSVVKMGQLMDLNKKKLIKQHLFTKLDLMVLNLAAIVTKLKKIKSVRPEMEHLLKMSEFSLLNLENYTILRQLLDDIFVEEDENIILHTILLSRIHRVVHSSYQEIIVHGWQKNLDKSGESKNMYYNMLVDGLPKDLKNLNNRKNMVDEIKDVSATMEMTGDSNESNVDIDTKDFLTMRKESRDSDDKLEDFEHFILTEIEKAVKNTERYTLQRYAELNGISRNVATEGKIKKVVKPGKIASQSAPSSQSKNGTTNGKIEKTNEKENESLDNSAEQKDADSGKPIAKDEDTLGTRTYKEPLSNKNSFLLPSTPLTVNSHNMESVSRDERQKLFQEIQKKIRNIRNNQKNRLDEKQTTEEVAKENDITSSDPLEEFKKPVWANDEEKSKEFTEFQQKSEVSDVEYDTMEGGDVEYQGEDYVVKLKSKKNDKEDRKSKHIDDEL